MKKSTKPFAWSYSALSAYETCPGKIRFKREGHIMEKNIYMQRGIDIHTEGEVYLKKARGEVPATYSKLKQEMIQLRKNSAIAEGEFAFTRNWAKKVSWFDKDVWFRAKIDAHYFDKTDPSLVHVIDFKTGRPKPSYILQDQIYTVAMFEAYPQAEKVKLGFWYVDHGLILPEKPKIFKRSNILNGWRKELDIRARRFETEKKWLEKKGAHCSYCEFSKRKNGPCKVG